MNPVKPLNVKALSRPIRVTFLVNPAHTSHEEINDIIAFVTKAWGGFAFPIIPCDGSNINENWWSLLTAIDPDYIYSIVDLEDQLVEKINRHILPVEIFLGKTKREAYSRSLSDIPWTDVHRAIDKYVNQPLFKDRTFILLKKGSKRSREIDFLIQNFGIIDGTIFTDQAFEHAQKKTFDIDQVEIKSFLKELAEARRNIVLPIELTREGINPIYWHRGDHFFDGRHIVIGDSILDRIYSFNRRILGYANIPFDGLWIPESFKNDPELLNLIGKFFDRHSWTNDNHSHKIVSYSIAPNAMDEIKALTSLNRHHHYDILQLDQNTLPVIKEPFSRNLTEMTSRFEILGEGHYSPINPPAIDSISLRPGNWAIELQIEFRGDPNIISSSSWTLPKIRRLVDGFFHPYTPARIDNQGLIVAITKRNQESIQLGIPSRQRLFFSILQQHEYPNLKPTKKERQRPKFSDLMSSNQGAYLRGMINLFGGLFTTGRTLEDPYWREVFKILAGKSTENEQRLQDEFDKIFLQKDAPPAGQVSISKDQYNQALNAASKVAFSIREEISQSEMDEQNLKSLHGRLSGESKKRGENHYRDGEKFDDDKKDDLNGFIEDGILIQGVNQKCEFCASQNWYRVDDLKSKLRCEKCYENFPLLSNPTWSFHLNSLLIEGFKRHGSIAVVQALYLLQSGAMGKTFVYLPSQNIHKEPSWDGSNPFAELDLMVLVDKKFAIAEVKSRLDGFTVDDLTKLEEVAVELKPHYVLLLAPYEEARTLQSEVRTKFNEMKKKLETHDIKTILYPMKWNSGNVFTLS